MKVFYFLTLFLLPIVASGQNLKASIQDSKNHSSPKAISTSSQLLYDSLYLERDDNSVMYCYFYHDRRTSPITDLQKNNYQNGANDFNQGHIYDPLGLAEGRVAGLSITKPGDDPNTKYDARIRGLSNIHGNTMPLIVVDGYLDASLENVDPADIESMTVLKDAAATAFYGIRGANGVILISTKQGGYNNNFVTYNASMNVENAIRRQPAMNRDEYLAFSNELDFAQATDLGYDTDWYDEILQTAISQAHNLSVSGGNLTRKYYGSVNYRGVDGVLANSGFDRLSTRFNVEQKALKDKLTLNLGVAGTMNHSEYGNSEAFHYAPVYNPTAPVRSDDPAYNVWDGYFQQILFAYYNPVALVNQTENDGKYSLFNIRLRGNYALTDNLSVNASYSLQSAGESHNRYISKYSLGDGINRNGLAFKSSDSHNNQLVEAGFKWNDWFDFGDFTIESGYSYQEFVNEGFYAEGGDFITDAYTYNSLAAANDFKSGLGNVGSYKNSTKIIGWHGRVNYSWKERLFLNVVGRYDGSTMFGENVKNGFYQGISAGVDFARFMEYSSFLEILKLRVGYGKSGQTIDSNYRSLTLMGQSNYSIFYNGTYMPSYSMDNVAYPDLKASAKTEINIGVDFNFKSIVDGSLDYYTNTISDLVWPWSQPEYPYAAYWYNSGELHNSGLELNLNAYLFQDKKITWFPSIILTNYFNTSLGTFSDPEKGLNFQERHYLYPAGPGSSEFGKIIVQENEKIGNFYGLTYEGISETGNWLFEDLNNDQIISSEDQRIIGNAMPKVELGFGNYLTCDHWDLSVFFKGIFGYDMVNEYRATYGVPRNVTSYNVPRTVKEMMSDNGEYLRDWAKFSSYYLEKGNYFKLDNFSLGYNVNLSAKSTIRDLRIYLTGNNVFVITSYSGSDPEIRYSDSRFEYNPLAPGMERMSEWLMTRSFALGVTIKL